MAAYSYRNVLSGSLVSTFQLEAEAIYDDVLNGYVADDRLVSVSVIDDKYIGPVTALLFSALSLKDQTITYNGQVLQLQRKDSPIFTDAPILKELSLIIVESSPIDVPVVTLQELSLSITQVNPIVVPVITLNELSLSITTVPITLNELSLSITTVPNNAVTLKELSLTVS